MNVTIAALLVSMLIPPQAGDRFDLVCVGTQQTTTAPVRRWEDRLRVDLGAGVFCWKNCTYRASIFRITEGEIYFTNGGGTTSINRITGQFTSIEPAPGEGYRSIDGNCTRAEFTPITPRAFWSAPH